MSAGNGIIDHERMHAALQRVMRNLNPADAIRDREIRGESMTAVREVYGRPEPQVRGRRGARPKLMQTGNLKPQDSWTVLRRSMSC